MITSQRLRAILVGGSIGGALDILFAITWAMINGRTPAWLLQTVATGLLVFFAMRLVVLPASAFPYPVTFSQPGATLDLLSHMFLFGLPIAFAAAKALRPGNGR